MGASDVEDAAMSTAEAGHWCEGEKQQQCERMQESGNHRAEQIGSRRGRAPVSFLYSVKL